MGKSVSSARTRLQELSRILNLDYLDITNHRRAKPFPGSRYCPPRKAELGDRAEELVWERKMEMESSNGGQGEGSRVPLSLVVSDCVKRWFQDTLKEAKSGDVSMQVLVGQMYYSGYGVPRDAQKGRIWISRASKCRSSAWKVSDKRPGYNVSDSDSDELQHDS